jgi:hypothetical protein
MDSPEARPEERVAVVVPAYRVAAQIEQVIHGIPRWVRWIASCWCATASI